MDHDTRARLIDDDAGITALLAQVKRVAVLGIKTDAQSGQPSYYVPQALQRAGLEIIPIPVYYPEATEILGATVYRKLADVPGELDLVDVFRRPQDLDAHFEDIVAKRPKAVWLQSGIRNDDFAQRLVREGISVVQDHCLMVEYRRRHG